MQPFQYSLVADSVFEKGSEMHFIIRFMNTYLKLIFIFIILLILGVLGFWGWRVARRGCLSSELPAKNLS